MTIRSITPAISEAPYREPSTILLCRPGETKPIRYMLHPWARRDSRWWSWHIVARPRTRWADQVTAARVWWNGGGQDPEIRAEVVSPFSDLWGNRARWGIANDFRSEPDGHSFTPDMGTPFGGRGFYPAGPGNFLAVVRWADRLVTGLYGPLEVRP